MTRRLSLVSKAMHVKAMNHLSFGSKRPKPDCAYCRNSEFRGMDFVCRKGLKESPSTCGEWRDSRDNLANNHLDFEA
jgi:hypothetical protein